jgi:hypothetical protein
MKFDLDTLRPLVQQIVRQTVDELLARLPDLTDRDAYTEAEAAARLGLKRHQLRDERLRGRVTYARGPRGTPLYRPVDLAAYLSRKD